MNISKRIFCIKNIEDDSFLFCLGDLSFCSNIELAEKFLYFEVANLVREFLNFKLDCKYFVLVEL